MFLLPKGQMLIIFFYLSIHFRRIFIFYHINVNLNFHWCINVTVQCVIYILSYCKCEYYFYTSVDLLGIYIHIIFPTTKSWFKRWFGSNQYDTEQINYTYFHLLYIYYQVSVSTNYLTFLYCTIYIFLIYWYI